MRRITVSAAALLLLLAGCSTQPAPEPSPTITGTPAPDPEPTPEMIDAVGAIGVSANNAIVSEHLCSPYGDYSEPYKTPTQAVILGAQGQIVATADLGESEMIDGEAGCARWWSAQIPAGQGFYTVRIGEAESQVYTEAEVREQRLLVLLEDI